MHHRLVGPAALAVMAASLATPAFISSAAAADESRVVHFVVDVSGSMSGVPLEQAKTALREAATGLTSNDLVGVRSYAGSCGDTGDLIVPIDTFNAATFDAAVTSLSAGGGTPTPDALRGAAADLPSSGDRTIVLISDGQSTCGDPCPAAQSIKNELGVDFRVHAVGFNAPTQAASELTCIANVTGGQYIPATDTDTLRDAIDDLVGGGQGCPDAYFVAAMGSGEAFTSVDDLSPSPTLKTVYDAALTRTAGLDVELRVINYPATSVDAIFAGLKSTKNKVELVRKLQDNAKKYLAGEKQGVAALETLMAELNVGSCRRAKVVLAGYSQGAMVVHDWMNSPSRGTHREVVAAVLVADPERVLESTLLNFGDAPFATTGFMGSKGVCSVVSAAFSCTAPQPLQEVSSTFASKTVTVCDEYDLVCDTGTIVDNYPVNTQEGRASLINLGKSIHTAYRIRPATKSAGMWAGMRIAR